VDSLRGQLLVASPALDDPNFRRTVILLGEHSHRGAVGLVLNRPSPTEVVEAVPALESLVEMGTTFFIGGPVAPSVVMVLARMSDPEDAGTLEGQVIGFLSAETDLEDLGHQAVETRVFAGYAGWGPGQLEAELERADWIVHPPEEGDIFTEEPDRLWSAVLERMGGQYSLLARMPLDPSLN
jgi:putative transcriptional regulator